MSPVVLTLEGAQSSDMSAELDLPYVVHFRQGSERRDQRRAQPGIDADCRQRLSTGLETALVILRDVDPGIAQQRAHASNDSRYIAISQEQERALRNEIHMELPQPHDA